MAVVHRRSAAAGQVLEHGLGVHRPGEEEALAELAAELAQGGPLLGLLDALGHDVEIESRAERERPRRPGPDISGVAPSPEERPVHLQDVHREAAEVAERRVAGPEVVERQVHAERLELLEPRHRELRVGHQDGLRDLERERGRVDPGLVDGVADIGDHVAVLQLLHGQVDAHRESQRPAARASRIRRAWRQPSRSTHRPIGMISPVSSASGMNWSGGIIPRSGWRQRSSASTPRDAAVVDPDDRLVVQLQLLGRYRALEVGAKLEPGEHALVHLRLEHPVAALAVALGAVHRGVGVADQLLRAGRPRPATQPRCRCCTEARAPCGRPAAAAPATRARGRPCRPPPAPPRCPRAATRTRRHRSARLCRSRGCSSPAASPPPRAPRLRRHDRGCR